MQKTDRLHELVHSMSKAEKRAFKLRAQGRSERTRYLELFDLLAAMAIYDEAELRRQLSDPGTIKNLRQAKHYLKAAILRCLSDLHAYGDDLRTADTLLGTASMLAERQLHEHEFEILLKAEKKARDNGNVMTALRSQMMQMTVLPIIESDGAVLRTALDQHNSRLKADLEQIRVMVDYRWLQSAMVILMDTVGTPRTQTEVEEFNKLARHPALLEGKFLDNPQCAILYYDTAYNYHMVMKNHPAAEYSAQKLMQAVSKNETYAMLKSRALLRLAQIYSNMLDHARFGAIWEDTLLPKKGEAPLYMLRETLHFLNIFQIKMLTHSGHFAEAYEVYRRACRIFNNEQPALGASELSITIFHYFYACFGFGKFNEAFEWLQRITTDPVLNRRSDVSTFAHIATLITHFELGDLSAMDYIIRSTYKYLRSNQGVYKVEELVLEFINNLSSLDPKEDLQQHFKAARMRLAEIKDDPVEKGILELFHLDAWLRAKIEQRPFGETVKQEAALERERILADYAKNSVKMRRADGSISLFDQLHS